MTIKDPSPKTQLPHVIEASVFATNQGECGSHEGRKGCIVVDGGAHPECSYCKRKKRTHCRLMLIPTRIPDGANCLLAGKISGFVFHTKRQTR